MERPGYVATPDDGVQRFDPTNRWGNPTPLAGSGPVTPVNCSCDTLQAK